MANVQLQTYGSRVDAGSKPTRVDKPAPRTVRVRRAGRAMIPGGPVWVPRHRAGSAGPTRGEATMTTLRGHKEFEGLSVPGQPTRVSTWVRPGPPGYVNLATGTNHRPVTLRRDQAVALARHLLQIAQEA